MISLILGTCVNKLVIGIFKDKEKICFECEETNNDLSGKVLDHLNKLLLENNLKINDINEIYVVNGPGSFTGIRIGVTIAKTLAWSLKCPIYTVSELMLEATTKTDKKYVVPMIDARRGFIYAAMYDNKLKTILKEQYVEKDKFIASIEENYKLEDVEFVSYDTFLNVVSPQLCVEKILELDFKAINPHSVNPNYLKRTEAEEKLSDTNN